jgi:hypothetical protein
MLVCHYLIGKRKDGYIMRIQEDGSNGIVDTTWAEEYPLKMRDKLKDGKL